MQTYSYTALDAQGKQSKGLLEASDPAEALRRIKEMGQYPTQVAPVPARGGVRRRGLAGAPSASIPGHGGGRLAEAVARMRSRVPSRTLTAFTRQLSTLLDAGMPLVRGLQILAGQERNPQMKRAIAQIAQAIEGGETFSEGLMRRPRIFGPLYVSMARAGEAGGVLDVVLDRLATFQEKAERIKGRVVSAMFYPAAVLAVAIALMGLLMVFVVPRFEAVFSDLTGNRPLPGFTRFVLGLSTQARDHLPALLIAVFGLAAGVKLAASTRSGRRALDRAKLQLPILGPVMAKAAISRFSRTLGTLVSSGVPILQALTIVRDTAGNVVVGDAVDRVHQSVKEGETIAVPLRASGVFPDLVVGMVDIGEQTGALPDMLMKIADQYDEEVDNAVAAMTSLLEPVMIVLLAIVVGSIVVALFLPIVALIDQGFDSGGLAGDEGV